MPRSLVLGNGNILVCLDQYGQLRDFYFHYVGLENQMYKGCVGRIGVWIENQFSAITDPDWQILVDYKYETLIGNIVAVNPRLELELKFSDCVYNEKNIFIREVSVRNKAQREREIRVFFNHQFHLFESKVSDTGYFDPQDNTIVHYKGRRLMVIGGEHNGKSFSDYTIGVFGIEGKQGTWFDCFDGLLSKNPVEHGPVDSSIAFEQKVDANGEFNFHYWLCIDKTLHDVKALHKLVLQKGPSHIEKTTSDFWKAWVNKNDIDLTGLPRPVSDLFKKSLLIMRTHLDNTGGIIASGDSDMLQFGKDTYSYVWPRDAAFVATALDNAGYHEVVRRFFDFANSVISDDGYFYHKYRPDKSLGSSWHPWT
ncbi:MAG: glucoamylase [Candidatus Woesebacteria bacterium GW2011_GWB1_38_5b]|uniref:Glucoamylase n=1 Tax=Candidatus Woesebacteria bacterium GW2011_GWB1_38_5b TaxID=1618569 RepID=A0A0G0K8U9_9BACT|nr:MAG: glucoamylase [Candidatus Woesebacteria bacterium GW2011_GWB1_38_5b]